MTATVKLADTPESGVLSFAGELTLAGVGAVWPQAMAAARKAAGHALQIDLAAVPHADTAGATLLAAVERAHGGPVSVAGATPELASLLDLVRAARKTPPPAAAPSDPAPLRAALRAMLDNVAFLGEVAVAVLRAPTRHRMFKLRDMMAFADSAGVRAIPLVVLLGSLMGLILAFQSSIPLRRFGAEIYVVNLVVISLLRELGPLLAAIILAGRTGSAFAAELGTMVVNDEVAAISTMGIDPVTMLVLPRLAAAMLVMPGLALILELAGLAGMTVVMGILGFPPVAVLHQGLASARVSDLAGGMVKAFCFGAAVAVIGCRTGLGAGSGPRAVGQAATAAVVGGIVATILLDGLFTVLYFRLGL